MINFSVIGTLAYWLFSQIACWESQANGQASVCKSIDLDGRVALTVFRMCGAKAVVTLTEEQLLEEGPVSCVFLLVHPGDTSVVMNMKLYIRTYPTYTYIHATYVNVYIFDR